MDKRNRRPYQGEFLFRQLSAAAGHSDQKIIEFECFGIESGSGEQVSRWFRGVNSPNRGYMTAAAKFVHEANQTDESFSNFQRAFFQSFQFLKMLEGGETTLHTNIPTLARRFLVEIGALEGNSVSNPTLLGKQVPKIPEDQSKDTQGSKPGQNDGRLSRATNVDQASMTVTERDLNAHNISPELEQQRRSYSKLERQKRYDLELIATWLEIPRPYDLTEAEIVAAIDEVASAFRRMKLTFDPKTTVDGTRTNHSQIIPIRGKIATGVPIEAIRKEEFYIDPARCNILSLPEMAAEAWDRKDLKAAGYLFQASINMLRNAERT